MATQQWAALDLRSGLWPSSAVTADRASNTFDLPPALASYGAAPGCVILYGSTVRGPVTGAQPAAPACLTRHYHSARTTRYDCCSLPNNPSSGVLASLVVPRRTADCRTYGNSTDKYSVRGEYLARPIYSIAKTDLKGNESQADAIRRSLLSRTAEQRSCRGPASATVPSPPL